METVKNDWLQTSGNFHIRDIAQHYGVYQHLFGDAFFVPRVPLQISYQQSGAETAVPVYYGNTIKPSEAGRRPDVQFDSNVALSGDVSVAVKNGK